MDFCRCKQINARGLKLHSLLFLGKIVNSTWLRVANIKTYKFVLKADEEYVTDFFTRASLKGVDSTL